MFDNKSVRLRSLEAHNKSSKMTNRQGVALRLNAISRVVMLATIAIFFQSLAESQTGTSTEEISASGDSAGVVVPSITREEIGAAMVPSPFALPSPLAWFRAFEKHGSPRWRHFYRDSGSFSIVDRHKAALVLGVTLTDAYVAVESRGSQEVRNVLVNVRTLEKTLGISERMQQRHTRLGELADGEQWAALRVELAAMATEQAELLKQQRDAPLADLIPFGMILQTIAISCDIVRDLQIDERLCIGDITLLILMIRYVEALPEATLKERSVRDLRRCLKSVRDYWIDEPPEPVEDKVLATRTALHEFLGSLVVNK
ncbi:MAG: hypothetical protein ACI9R3_003923 [Verrucomicrobiales bacterium]|jgi:hypothetical protein